jgi:hypothetical protein
MEWEETRDNNNKRSCRDDTEVSCRRCGQQTSQEDAAQPSLVCPQWWPQYHEDYCSWECCWAALSPGFTGDPITRQALRNRMQGLAHRPIQPPVPVPCLYPTTTKSAAAAAALPVSRHEEDDEAECFL